MSLTNISCDHKMLFNSKTNQEKTNFCIKCGTMCFIFYNDNNKKELFCNFSIKPKFFNSIVSFPPIETFKIIKRVVNSSSHTFKNKYDISEDYRSKRKGMIEGIKCLISEYNFSDRSYILAIFMMDYIYLNYVSDKIKKLKIELVVIACFLIADSFPTKKNPTIYYSLNEVRKYEDIIIKLINFKMNYFTSFYILETLLSNGIVLKNEVEEEGFFEEEEFEQNQKILKLYKLTENINKIFIEDISSVVFNNLDIAFSCVILAKEVLNYDSPWTEELENFYEMDINSIKECYSVLYKLYKNSYLFYQEGTSFKENNNSLFNNIKPKEKKAVITTKSKSTNNIVLIEKSKNLMNKVTDEHIQNNKIKNDLLIMKKCKKQCTTKNMIYIPYTGDVIPTQNLYMNKNHKTAKLMKVNNLIDKNERFKKVEICEKEEMVSISTTTSITSSKVSKPKKSCLK